MKEEVDKEVAARMKMKEKVEAKYNPDISLASSERAENKKINCNSCNQSKC